MSLSRDLANLALKRATYDSICDAIPNMKEPDVQRACLKFLMEKFPERAFGKDSWLKCILGSHSWAQVVLQDIACDWCAHTVCRVAKDLQCYNLCHELSWSGPCDYPESIRQGLKTLLLSPHADYEEVVIWVADNLTGPFFWSSVFRLFEFPAAPWVMDLARFALQQRSLSATPCVIPFGAFEPNTTEGWERLENLSGVNKCDNHELFELILTWCASRPKVPKRHEWETSGTICCNGICSPQEEDAVAKRDEWETSGTICVNGICSPQEEDAAWIFRVKYPPKPAFVDVLLKSKCKMKLQLELQYLAQTEKLVEIAASRNVSVALCKRDAVRLGYPRADWERKQRIWIDQPQRKTEWVRTLAESVFVPELAQTVAEYCLICWDMAVELV